MNKPKNQIQMIPIDKLINHPNNPRKDYGVLEELSESIKANGVLQNLTVVPEWGDLARAYDENPSDEIRIKLNQVRLNDRYLVVIGNRRKRAAELAGLTELPCVVVNMTPQEQLATMLLENIQRNDLTIYEQAQGFQLMLDFGESVNDIAEKTGFSQNTIRKRVKLLELDQIKLRRAAERQVTLADFDELNKFDDVKTRNKLLEFIGTDNFKYQLTGELRKQETEKQEKYWKEYLSDFAEYLDKAPGWNSKYKSMKSFHISKNLEEVEIPSEEEFEKKQHYFAFQYGWCYIYVKREKKEEESEEAAAQRIKQEKTEGAKRQLSELFKTAYETRFEFIKNYSKAKANVLVGVKAFISSCSRYDRYNYFGIFARLLGFSKTECSGEFYKKVEEAAEKEPEKAFLYGVYSQLNDGPELTCYNYDACYVKIERLERIYEFLIELGYKMSDDEKALLDGTHEAYLELEDI